MSGRNAAPATQAGPVRPATVRALRWAVILLLVANGCAVVSKGANRPADPYLVEPTTATPGGPPAPADRSPLAGFGEIAFRIEGPGAPVALRCALLADSAALQAKGLMGVTDLGGYDGMLFRFTSDTTGGFFMRDTPMPLSIAWFDADGDLVSTADMEPCLDGGTCPTYHAADPYRDALEVPQGALGQLGVGPGSSIDIGGRCP